MTRAAESKQALRATWLATRVAGAVSARLAGPPAARLWFTPWRIPVGARATRRQAEWLEGTNPLTFPNGRDQIAGYSAGDGPTVLLVHGWGESGASLGAFVAPLTAAGYRVVGIDLPGHGASSGGMTDLFELATALRGVGEMLGDVHAVVAHSAGAAASMYAVAEGLDVDALALIAPSVRLDHALDTFTKLFSLPPKARAGLAATIERRYGRDVWERFSGETVAARVDVPALIVHDRDDTQVAFADAEALHAVWPSSKLITTESLGHGRILRDPAVLDAVTKFLQEARERVASGA